MDKHFIETLIDQHDWIMGRITTEELTYQYIDEKFQEKWKDYVLCREVGEQTEKTHYHFVLAIKKGEYKDAVVARESVRKWLKKELSLKGQGAHSVKISLKPLEAVAYTMKQKDYKQYGLHPFFFHTVALSLMMGKSNLPIHENSWKQIRKNCFKNISLIY